MRIAFDIIGSKEKAVAIIEKDGRAAEEIMARYRHVKSVLQKKSARKGIHRIYKYRLLVGEKNTEVFHKEHGCVFKLDPRKAYFSPRESTERQRIAEKVKEGEKILVMFSGVSPFGIVLAKNKKCDVACVETNKKAFGYAEENLKLNKLKGNIKNYRADIGKIYKKLGKFDRILMPLPEKAWKYLDVALFCSKKNTAIHLYGICRDFKELEEKIKNAAKKCKRKIKIIERQKVLPYAPRIWKVRVDIKV